MKLFPTDKVKKFFDILQKLSGSTPIDSSTYRYKDYLTIYTKDSNHIPSTREVFVNRTVAKWLKGKYAIIYRKSDLGVEYKQYVSITNIAHFNDWSVTGYVGVGLMDYANPYSSSLFAKEHFGHNTCLNIEGEWSENGDKHTKLLSYISMEDVPTKEYVFRAYDFTKYPKRGVSSDKAMKKIETTMSFFAKTENSAYEQKNHYKGNLTITELIEIKQ